MKKPWKPAPSPIAASAARPKLGHQQSIRGRISGPIPIPNPLDDEFPIRTPGTGIASPVDAEFKEHPSEPVQMLEQEPEQSMTPQAALYASHADDAHPTTSGSDPTLSGSAPTTIVRGSPARANVPNTVRYSIVSAGTTQSKGSRERQHQRKKSTLRGALGKLFGRKKKSNGITNSPGNTDSESGFAPGGTNQHRSDAIVRTRPFNGIETKRIASLPITEYDRALRSHSIGPDDVLAIESARNSLSADFSLSRPRRAGTASTHLVGVLRSRDESLAGLSPRPASTHGRDTRTSEHIDDPNEIGRAITVDYTGLRRRSRSLSGLVEVVDDHGGVRRRSDEIRYWRESYDPAFMSPASSNAPGAEKENVRPEGVEMAESVQDNHQYQAPLEPFSFGSLASMNEMAGMKITQAAGMETRIGSLETRVQRLESVVTQLCNAVPNFRPQIDPPDRSAPAVPSAEPSITRSVSVNSPYRQTAVHDPDVSTRASNSRHSESSHMSFGEAPTFVGSVYKSSLHPPSIPHRPTSTATIREATSLPTLSKDLTGPFTVDHYATIMALIETERSARLALETQVRNLGHQLNIMSKSSGSRHLSTFEPPPTAKSFGERSAFDHDEDEEHGVIRNKPRSRTHRTEDSGIATEMGDDDEYSEAFETPREEIYNYGAFGEDLNGEDRTYDKSARTLSLSQLTLGRNPKNRQQPPPQAI